MNKDRFKFRVWNKDDEAYEETTSFDCVRIDNDGQLRIHNYSDASETIEDYTDSYIIEQCTGLKDRNGNLIYESDYVKANDVIYRVFWDKTKISLVNILNGDTIDISETITMEIVGNEHEKDNISEIPKNTERRFN